MEVVGDGHDLIKKAPGNTQICLSAMHQEGGGRTEAGGGGGWVTGVAEGGQQPDHKGT